MSEHLPPIPTPSAQVWRQLRLQYLPVLVFVTGIVVAALLWTHWVAPPTLVGETEAVRTDVRTTHSGTLMDLNVDLLAPVKAGQAIGRVLVSDPKVLDASLGVIRAEIEVLRSTTNMSFERLHLDFMSKRVELVSLQSQLYQAEATLARVASLYKIKLVTDEEYEEAKNTRDGFQARVKAQQELITRIEPDLQPTKVTDGRTVPTATAAGLIASVKQKEEQLRLIEAQMSPVPLIAPIDGVVTLLHRRSGEVVTTSESILQISATRTTRIIGFLRQPLPVEPKAGMEVQVRTRTFLRRVGVAHVVQVGTQLEPISPTLLAAMRLPVANIPTDFGLRVHVAVPENLGLRPGEQVDLIIRE